MAVGGKKLRVKRPRKPPCLCGGYGYIPCRACLGSGASQKTGDYCRRCDGTGQKACSGCASDEGQWEQLEESAALTTGE